MKDIREMLFAAYSDKMENSEPTALDRALNNSLSKLEDLDSQLFLEMYEAVTDVINEQMKLSYMTGFNTGARTCRVVYAVTA